VTTPQELPLTTNSQTPDRLIIRGALSTAGGFAIRFGARFLFLFVAGHFYGAALFGAYSVAVAVVEALIGLAGLSLKKTLFDMLDRNQEEGRREPLHVVLDAVLLILAVGGSLAALVMAVAAAAPHHVLGQATATALFWLAPMIASQTLADVLFTSTRWKNTVTAEVVGRSVVEPYALVAGAALGYICGIHEHGLILGYWLGNIALDAYAISQVRRFYGGLHLRSYGFDSAALGATVTSLLPNTTTEFASGVYARLDLYLVRILLGERWAGIYAMAQQVRTPVRQVRQSFDGLLVPLVSRTLTERGTTATQNAIATVARLILAIQLPILLLLAAGGASLLELFGKGFGVAYWALLLLVLAEIINGSFGIGDLLFVYRRPARGMRITLITAGVGLVAGYLLIEAFGITGGGLSVLLAYSTQAALRRAALRAHFGSKVPLTHNAGPLLSATIAAGCVAAGNSIAPSGLWLQALIGGGSVAVYAGVLWIWVKLTGQKMSIVGFSAGGVS